MRFLVDVQLQLLLENHTSKKIKVSRVDNNGEFHSGEFDKFCEELKVIRQIHIPINIMYL
jgi:hypothetical protein